ncbi:MAG: hypothetical protein AAFW73_04015 [Bacteroidota bacterium]
MSTMRFLLLALFLSSLVACTEEAPIVPKPRAFPKIEYPERVYQSFDPNFCRFKFEYPSYALVEQDTSFFGESPVDPCWFDLRIPAFDARLHCSYHPVGENFEKLRNDAFSLANKHNIKANYIDELPIEKPNGVRGFVFNIEGPVASPFQFYLTDVDDQHFLRASLYFNTQARPDSLAPVLDFVKTDLMHLINTFEWTGS